MPALRRVVLVVVLLGSFSSSARSGPPSAYDPDQHLHVRDAVAARHTREAIIRYIWKKTTGLIPPVQPSQTKEVSDTEFFHLKSDNILRITQLDHAMHLGLTSRSYLFSSAHHKGCSSFFMRDMVKIPQQAAKMTSCGARLTGDAT
jgi:hypothetical protein